MQWPGDTQNMRVVVSSPYGIKEVRAEIQTDNAQKVIPLKKTGVVSWRNLMPPKYRVDENGTLRILSEKEIAQNYARLVAMDESNQANLVQAADGEAAAQKEVWTGSWVVEDTHQTTYRTVFIATDNKGNSDRLTLAWSDPCTDLRNQVSGNYQLTNSCTVNSTDGIAAGNLTGAGGTCSQANRCTLTIDADFAFYPGKQITIDSNYQISIGTGAIKQTYLWVGPDADSDGYIWEEAPFVKKAQDTSPGTGWVKQETVNSLTSFDCYDADTSSFKRAQFAYPGQTSYFTTDRGDGSFDYNCDYTEEKKYTTTMGNVCAWQSSDLTCNQVYFSGSGWQGSVPNCGVSGTFNDATGVTCSNYQGNYSGCINAGKYTQTQACR